MLQRLIRSAAQKQICRSYNSGRKQTWGGRRPFLRPEAPRKTGMSIDMVLLRLIKQKNLVGTKKILRTVEAEGVFARNEELAVLLIELFGKNNWVSDARRVFASLKKPNTFAWHFMIQAYVLAGRIDEAREMFDQMPSIATSTRNMMIGAYIDKDRLQEAQELFDKKKKEFPDMITWSLLFTAYVRKEDLQQAKELLKVMPKNIEVAWNTMLQAYCKKGFLREAREVLDSMPSKNVLSYRMAVYAFARRGHLLEAREILNQMEEIDSVLWNEMIQIYAQHGRIGDAYDMIKKLRARTTPASFTCLMQAFGRAGNVKMAKEIFDTALNPPDLIAINSMVTAFARNGQIDEARSIFSGMEERNEVTWSNMILGCAQHNRLAEARKLLEESPYESVIPSTAVVAGYARIGQMVEAQQLFESLKLRNVVTWTVMIGGYAQNGNPKISLDLFHEMNQEGVAADGFAFAAVLTACRHVGQLNNGRSYFHSMSCDYGVNPEIEHYHCMIDILGQAAQLQQAEDLINTMPFVPDATSWTSLLGFCNTHGDFQRAKRAARRAHPRVSSPYVLLSNLYATSSYVDESSPRDQSSTDYGIPMAHLFFC